MTIVARKISVFGDSTSITPSGGTQSRADRIYNYNPAKFGGAGYNDCAHGGHSLAYNLNTSVFKNNVEQNIAFPNYIQTVDDSDIVLIILGGNDPLSAAAGGTLDANAHAQDYIGADALTNASYYLQHVQYARSAGKRPVLVGLPYYNAWKALQPGGLRYNLPGTDVEQAQQFGTRLVANQVALRITAAMNNVPYILPYGAGSSGGQPAASDQSVSDGLHPTPAYANAVSDYIASELIRIFNL